MKKAIIIAAAIVLLSQSVFAGVIYTNVTLPVTATGSDNATKVGTATAYNFFWLFSFGDAGINAAARSGNITKISHVDRNEFMLLGIVGSTSTYVYGQ